MAQEFISAQSKWRIAAVGSVLVALELVLSLLLLSSDGYDRALAEEIAQNSPDVRTALGEDKIEILQIVEEDDIVVCSSGMQLPIAVKVDLETKRVITIANVNLPALTDEEKEKAIDLAKSFPAFPTPINPTLIQDVEVYPAFISGKVATDIGDITLLPGPKMAIVKFDLVGDPSVIRVKVDLDNMMVTDIQEEGTSVNSQGNIIARIRIGEDSEETVDSFQSTMEQMKEEAKARVIELIEADPTGRALMEQGFTIHEDDIWVFPADTYLEPIEGETIAVSAPVSARVELKNGYISRIAFVDLREEKVQWVSNTYEADEVSRQSALDIVAVSEQTATLLEQGAKAYVIGYRDIWYKISDTGISGGWNLADYRAGWLVLGDKLWTARVDITSGELIDLQGLPPDLRLSPSKLETVNSILEATPEAIELLEQGAEVIFFMKPNTQANIDHESGIAVLHIEGTGAFWQATINLDESRLFFLIRE